MEYILLVIFIIVLFTSILMIVQGRSEIIDFSDEEILEQDVENKKRFDFKHLLIRLAITIFLPVIVFLVSMYLSNNEHRDREHPVNSAMGPIAVVAMEVFIWYIYITLETIWLHFKKKYPKRNSNLLIISISTFIGILFCILVIIKNF